MLPPPSPLSGQHAQAVHTLTPFLLLLNIQSYIIVIPHNNKSF